ncbi:MAG: nucleotidyl transferase AbiEii/AbiGii toxin family protein [Mycoplasmoidaceae bacterium]|nr:nucleotidyl transferase AbiEii/AbiGii toxin family protein [Mycoplasmoidaceae bacterium]
MDNVLKTMLNKHHATNVSQQRNALREEIQNLILYCLSKTDFFKYTAFYGGTCLRICHNLNRFSEDLDFCLIKEQKDFDLKKYGENVILTLQSFGLKGQLSSKVKKIETSVLSMFINFDLKELIKTFYPTANKVKVTHGERLSIKVEVETKPTPEAVIEPIYLMSPYGFAIKKFDLSSLFAAKIECVLARS